MSRPYDDDPAWQEWVEGMRERSLRPMCESAVFVHIASKQPASVDDLDVGYCLELGAMILLGKPIVIVVPPGAHVPGVLRDVAAAVIEEDIDTEAGREAFRLALADLDVGT